MAVLQTAVLFEVGIPNSVCGYIMGVRTVTHCFQIKALIWIFDLSS